MILTRPDFGEVVAEEQFIFLSGSGIETLVIAKIGRPYPEENSTWACPCELKGFEPRYADARGEGSLQALALALFLIRSRLRDFLAQGGKLLEPNERQEYSAADLDAFYFKQ